MTDRWANGPRIPRCRLRQIRRYLSPPSFRGDAKHRTMVLDCAPENLEIPGLVLAHHPGMTEKVSRRQVGIRRDLRIRLVHEIKPRDHQERRGAEGEDRKSVV